MHKNRRYATLSFGKKVDFSCTIVQNSAFFAVSFFPADSEMGVSLYRNSAPKFLFMQENE